MKLSVNGAEVFVATGGREFDKSLPTVVFVHGAGFDHSTWALHTRWFAHHGFGVLAPDLPGHGRSAGPSLTSIADMADWTAALLDAAGAAKAHLIGHSMGSLISLETAARHPDKVSALSLIGTAATMTVGPDLLKAAEANDAGRNRHGLDLGPRLQRRTRRQPRAGPVDAWRRAGGAEALRAGRAVQGFVGLQCLRECAQAAATVKVPATLILGERDMMTPAKAGKALAAAIPHAKTVVVPGAGHMIMAERPDELLAALKG